MGRIKDYQPEKLIAGVIYRREEDYLRARQILEKNFGTIDYESAGFPFTYTSYYTAEMGPDLKRRFLAFENLINPERLAEIKIFTNHLEEELSQEGNRRVNIDPGLLSLGKLVLATTKNQHTRVPIGRGIFGEVTLHFQNEEYQPFESTYPDYRGVLYRKVFGKIREIYLQKLKTLTAEKEVN